MAARDRLPATPARRWALVVAATSALASAWIGTRLAVRGIRTALRAVRFTVALATFRLYRRCPDCKTLIRADARVCRYCGFRRS